MKVMVTGGNGFIGSNFVRYLLQHTDMDVINVDSITYAAKAPHPTNPRYSFHQLDIAVPSILKILHDTKPDFIVNFAAETHVDRSINGPDKFIETNINCTYLFLQNLKQYMDTGGNFRFLHISTDEVYGQLNIGDAPFTEQSPYQPNNPYAASKASADHLVRSFVHTYKLPAIITHSSNNYGPYQFPEKFIPKAIISVLKNEPIEVYGTGENIRDWIYVTDNCAGIFQVMLRGVVGHHYNIGGGNELTNTQVATKILKLLNAPADNIMYVDDRKGHDYRYALSSKKLQTELSWIPVVEFDKGLLDTINWYKNNMDWVYKCIL